MTRDTYITLISRENGGANEYGTPVIKETRKRIHAQWDGVKRSEFYQAAAVGLQPTITFRIYAKAYNDQRYIEHADKKYRVIRTYPLSGERVELICTDDLETSDDV